MIGDMVICDKVCLGVVSTSTVKTLGLGIYYNGVPCGRQDFRQIKGGGGHLGEDVPRKLVHAFAVLLVPTAQNNMPKQFILKWHILNTWSYIRLYILLPFTRMSQRLHLLP